MTTEKRKYFGAKKREELNDFEKSSIKDFKNRFSRWHNKQIDLLTFCINLNFTISVAIAGFIISNQDKPIFKDQYICTKYSLVRTSLFLLASAATIGIIALISRLHDFRLTKNIIIARRRIFELNNNIRYESTKQSEKEKLNSTINTYIFRTKFLGNATWILLYLQISILLITIWTIVINAEISIILIGRFL